MISLDYSSNNDFINILDDNGQVTIQMKQIDLINVVKTFDGYVQSKTDVSQKFDVYDGVLELNLKFYGDYFCINGRVSEINNSDSSYYHDFELEDVDIETWGEIVKYVNV